MRVLSFDEGADGDDDPGATTGEALEASLDRHNGAALGALREVLLRHGFDDGGASAHTTRNGNALRVGLRVGTPNIDARVREIASVRALAAVRAVDPCAVRIGVCFDE